MKYIADKILIAPDETPSAIRKKVAQKLGVSPSSVRYTIIRRNWWRGKNGGAIEICVEAETNEFIHNTSYFPPEPQEAPAFDFRLKRSPVVVGFGLRGVIAAYILARNGLCPIVLEDGPSLNEPGSTKEVDSGEGGIGAKAGMLFSPALLNPQLKAILREEGITFDNADAHQVVSPAFIKSFVKKLRDIILSKGGQIIYHAKYLGTKKRFGRVHGVIFEEKGTQNFVRTDHVLICNGEYDDQFYLGFCIESSTRFFNQFVYGKAVVDPKLPTYYAESSYQSKGGSPCILMTGLGKASLKDIGSKQQRMMQVFDFSCKGNNAVSYLGVRVSKGELDKLTREGYIASKPSCVPYCTVADFLYHKTPLRLGSVKPSDTCQAQLTSLNKLYGSNISPILENALRQFGKAFPYLLQDDALVGGMIVFRGNSDPENADFLAKGLYFASNSPTKSFDFAATISAGFAASAALSANFKSN